MQEPQRPKEYRFTILGPPQVGKSNITSRFIKEKFTEEYDPTLEGNFTRSTYLDNEEFVVTVTDTAGQEDFVTLDCLWKNKRDGFIFVFAIDRMETFQDALKRLQDTKVDKSSTNVPCILVGNKVDLEKTRQVPTKTAEERAKHHNVKYLEVSAKENTNIELIFHELIRENELRKVYKPEGLRERKKGFIDNVSETCERNCTLF